MFTISVNGRFHATLFFRHPTTQHRPDEIQNDFDGTVIEFDHPFLDATLPLYQMASTFVKNFIVYDAFFFFLSLINYRFS